MKEYTFCPNCPGTVDNTIKGAALNLAAQGQGYAAMVYVNCPTCGALVMAKLEWSPVVKSVELAEAAADFEAYHSQYDDVRDS